MTRVAFIDCFSGISGDMFLGALIDAGVSSDALRAALAGLAVGGFRLEIARTTRQGISGYAVRVEMDDAEPQPPRQLRDVEAIIAESSFDPSVRERARDVFRALAGAEAAVHGIPVEEV